jgi:hypothetical protein
MTTEPKRRGRPTTGVTPVRNIRIRDEVWKPALDLAHERGETLTSVIEAALRRYIARHGAVA